MIDKDEIRNRIAKMRELEQELSSAGPAKAERIMREQEEIEEHYYADVSALLDECDRLESKEFLARTERDELREANKQLNQQRIVAIRASEDFEEMYKQEHREKNSVQRERDRLRELMREADATITELRTDLIVWKAKRELIESLQEERDRLREENAAMREALEWYASDYAQTINDESPIIRLEYPEYAQTYYEMDNGQRARILLSQISNKEGDRI